MELETLSITDGPQGLSFKVKVQPRASRSKIAGLIGDALKLQLTSPPVDGAANDACAEFWSEVLGIAKSRVSIISGVKSRNKVIQIAGYSKAEFVEKLIKHHAK